MNEVEERMNEVRAVVGWLSKEVDDELRNALNESVELKPNVGELSSWCAHNQDCIDNGGELP